ncbi:MAG: methylated-DNA--[protein]-cysteine S-methyltransferase, partial [Bifidobacteriaceae bacterium]|nr:methylated-DNA--[protein]-cysteine S-methyltransferase [Bifidobacteriaceae bacterium]
VEPELQPEHIEWVGEADTAFVGGAVAWAVGAVHRYYRGDVDAPMAVPVRQQGTEFVEAAWRAMRHIPPGQPYTYAELAAAAGRPAAARAAGTACSHNATALFVPCHRVVPSGRGIGNFGWGAPVKQALLAREAAAREAAAAAALRAAAEAATAAAEAARAAAADPAATADLAAAGQS